MVNSPDFIKRLEKILKYYEISASAFADKIAVQRSSISHLLTGRNKPSLEFVLKVITAYPDVNLYWLLKGKGEFPNKTDYTPTPIINTKAATLPISEAVKMAPSEIDKIVIFFKDGSFKSYEN